MSAHLSHDIGWHVMASDAQLLLTDRVRLRGVRPVAEAAGRLRTRPERYLKCLSRKNTDLGGGTP